MSTKYRHPTANKVVFQYGSHQVTLETGIIAPQATSAVWVRMGEGVVLVTLVAMKQLSSNMECLPLSVHYQERKYAVPRIPGGYFKREGRSSEHEILVSRLIDRSLRPAFPKNFCHEIQIIATVLSADPEIPSEIPALLGAGAAVALSGLPHNGPLASARVGHLGGQYQLNPTQSQLEDSALDLIVTGTKTAVLMVEAEADELSTDSLVGAIAFGHQQLQTALTAILELSQTSGRTQWHWEPSVPDVKLIQQFNEHVETPLRELFQLTENLTYKTQRNELRTRLIKEFTLESTEVTAKQLETAFGNMEAKLIRSRILAGQLRIDGRDTRTIRPIDIQTHILPRAHGSALFTRGGTQALVTTTLGTDRDAQLVDTLEGDSRESFMLHYNFPPYCVGETGQIGSPKRREIGHGNLAKRALRAVLPNEEEFLYTIRVASEILASDGSSSAATVCGACLSMRVAGIPLKKLVAAIAMGCVKEGTRFAILSDILASEDHLGDMDFKVAGTRDGITALQMDIKPDGIALEIIDTALTQAREGLYHILSCMESALEKSRIEISPHAPRIMSLQILPAKIRDVIGKGGATIRSITGETGTLIDISDNGLVRISGANANACQQALDKIKQVTAEAEIGAIYEGPVVKLIDAGAFVSILPGQDGFIHISEIIIQGDDDALKKGQIIKVKVLDIDRQKNRIRLTMKGIESVGEIFPLAG